MREIREILAQAASLAAGERAALATVVDLQGSGYRLPGARMLIKANGDSFGTVSGGCLEADVMERARRVLESGRAELFVYDTTADENSVFALNMGCRGVMRILLEPVGPDSEIIAALKIVNDERRRIELATLIGGGESLGLAVGERIIVEERDGKIIGPRSLVETLPQLRDDLLTIGGSSRPLETIRYEIEDETVEFAFESLSPPVHLHILGAGADAVPLAEIAHGLGWQVCVTDHRPAFLSRERFIIPCNLILIDRDTKPELSADALTAFVSMNHNYERDKAMLPAAIRSDAFYVGALGPKKRTAEILGELRADGEIFNEEQLSRLRSPAGLDIGGDTPESISLAIAAEIQSVLKHRNGGPLRDRDAPIYDRKK